MRIIKPIFLGIIAALGALVFELVVSIIFPGFNFSASAFSQSLLTFLALAAFIEESFKFLVIYKSFYKLTDTKEIIFSSLLLGLGFSLTEIFIINSSEIYSGANLYSGVAGIILVHTLTAGLIGYLLTKRREVKLSKIFTIIFLTALLHFSYNLAVILGYLQK